jgi:hypothetical protein
MGNELSGQKGFASWPQSDDVNYVLRGAGEGDLWAWQHEDGDETQLAANLGRDALRSGPAGLWRLLAEEQTGTGPGH